MCNEKPKEEVYYQHLHVHTELWNYMFQGTCTMCAATITNIGTLAQHLQEVHRKQLVHYVRTVLGSPGTHGNVKEIRTQTEKYLGINTTFTCDYLSCGSAFKTSQELKMHAQDEHACTVCHMIMSSAMAMTAHMLQHKSTGENHTCTKCGQKYGSMETLKLHLAKSFFCHIAYP